MTMLQDPDLPAAPPLGYWTARMMDVNRSKAAKALTDGIDRKIDEIMVQVETIERGLGFRPNPDPMIRLANYLRKPNTYAEAVMAQQQALAANQQRAVEGQPPRPVPPIWSWETQRAVLPLDYEKDWADFQNLRERAARGEFSRRLAE